MVEGSSVDGRYRALYRHRAARWLAILGYVLAVLLLFGGSFFSWSFAVFPLWVLLLSVSIPADNLRQSPVSP